jgi:hypothetical protein
VCALDGLDDRVRLSCLGVTKNKKLNKRLILERGGGMHLRYRA